MKEKIKDYIMTISIFIYISIIVLSILNIIGQKKEIDTSGYDSDKITEYKNELGMIEDNECKELINKHINYYEEVYSKDKINIKDFYNTSVNHSFLKGLLISNDVDKNPCHITSYDSNDNMLKVSTIFNSQDNIILNYIFNYELNIKDIYTRYTAVPSSIEFSLSVRRIAQLSIIDYLIDSEIEYENMEDVNE